MTSPPQTGVPLSETQQELGSAAAGTAARKPLSIKRLFGFGEPGVVLALIVLMAVVGAFHHRFLTADSLHGTLQTASFVAIIAYGMVFLLAMTEIDLSVGGTYAFAVIVSAKLMAEHNMNPWVAAITAIMVAGLMGALNGLLAWLFRLPLIIITLGTLSAFRGLVTVVSDAQPFQNLPLQSFGAVINAIFGRSKVADGSITMPDGRPAPTSMAAAVRAGIAAVPADRRALGVMLDKTIHENISTVSAGPLRRMGILLSKNRMVERARAWAQRLNIVMSSASAEVGRLSGANQQKVVFAKWLGTNPKVVLLDDPSRGVDIGATSEMHAIIAQMAQAKRIVLTTSSDLAELAAVSDRVVIFFQRTAVGELSGEQLTEHRLLQSINTGVVPETLERSAR